MTGAEKDRQQTAIKFVSDVILNMAKTAEQQPENRVYYGNLIDALTMGVHLWKTTSAEKWNMMDGRVQWKGEKK